MNEYKQFIRYGYKLDQDLEFSKLISDSLCRKKHKYLDKDVLLRKLLTFLQASVGSSKVLLPMSGGMDSRLLLECCLRLFGRERITLCSFGNNNSLDFLIANYLAEIYDLKFLRINLNDFEWDLDLYKKNKNPTWFIHSILNSFDYLNISKDVKIISGFLGDPPTGSHVKIDLESMDKCDSVNYFLKHNNFTGLHPEIDSYMLSLICDYNFFDKNKLNYAEQLDVTVRQFSMVKPIFNNPNFIFPFEQGFWVSAWYNLDVEQRLNQKAYKEFLLYVSEEGFGSFKYPLKNLFNTSLYDRSFKTFINRFYFKFNKKPMMNYFDFNNYSNKSYLELLGFGESKFPYTHIPQYSSNLFNRSLIASVGLNENYY